MRIPRPWFQPHCIPPTRSSCGRPLRLAWNEGVAPPWLPSSLLSRRTATELPRLHVRCALGWTCDSFLQGSERPARDRLPNAAKPALRAELTAEIEDSGGRWVRDRARRSGAARPSRRPRELELPATQVVRLGRLGRQAR